MISLVKRIVLANIRMLLTHFLSILVKFIGFIKFFNFFLRHNDFKFLLLFWDNICIARWVVSSVQLNFCCHTTSLLSIKCFFTAYCMVRVKLIIRIHHQIIALVCYNLWERNTVILNYWSLQLLDSLLRSENRM